MFVFEFEYQSKFQRSFLLHFSLLCGFRKAKKHFDKKSIFFNIQYVRVRDEFAELN